ncbi:MAG: 50S ribosomal protein L29 [Saprospiraceae bacterium]|nr:50S ribosomal protein L29 [Saprospiraceae bacterium]MCB0622884.1 50S ribosomal protein L29 [Saprospiraceae bacterium]MCB0677047.1 50S ribosomal protein L29 [Saprospiraceae bacterium]MCB0679780.1 50S ribosomal protein L29 [Saprospiraceae bacterium]
MATKKFLELQEYSDADLAAELQKTEQDYQKLQFDHAIKGLDNPITLREVRRDIARLKTEVRRRELSALSKEQLSMRSKIRARRRSKN